MKAEQLRKSILHLAIQGKLVPQDPNDEPASVLLERIRAEKQRLIKEGKIKKDKIDSFIYKGEDNRYYEKVGNNSPVCIDDDVSEFDLPEGWKFAKISALLKIQTGASFKKDSATTNPKLVRVLRGGNILNGSYNFFDNDIYLDNNLVSDAILLQRNDLITPAVTSIENIGKIARIEQTYNNVTAGGFVFILRPYYQIDELSKYLLYALQSSYFNKQLKAITKKSGQAFYNLGKERLLQLILPIPPLAEQIRIVKEIEKFEPLIAEYDKLEQQATKLDDEIYDKLKKSILQYAIQGKLVPQDPNDEPASVLLERIRAEKKAKLGKKYVDSYIYKGDDNCYYEKIGINEPNRLEDLPFDIPDSWCWARLGNIGDWGAGATPARTNSRYYGGNIPWLKTGELNNDVIYDSEEHVTDEALQSCSLRSCSIGDILIAMYGATIGKLAIAGAPLTTNQACCACTPYKGIYNLYLFYFLMEEKDNFTHMGFGGAQPNISKEKIIKHLFPVPPYEEQKRIVSAYIDIQNKLKDED